MPVRPEGGRPTGSRLRRAGLTALAGSGSRAAGLGLSLLTVPLTLNYLGEERYGMWITISSLIAILSLADLGVGNGLLNAVTSSLALGNENNARRQVSSALAVVLLASTGVAFAVFLAYDKVPWHQIAGVSSAQAIAEAGPAFGAFFLCFVVGMPLTIVSQVRHARQEGYLVHLTALLGNVVGLAALIVGIHTHQSVPVLVFTYAAPPIVAGLLNGVVLFYKDAPGLRPAVRLAERRIAFALLRVGVLFLVLQASFAIAFTLHPIVLAQTVGPEGVAEYGVVARLFLIPAGLVATGLAPLWPAYADALARGDLHWVRRTMAASTFVATGGAMASAVVLILIAPALLSLWVGERFEPSYVLLVSFGAWVSVTACGAAVAMLLNGAGAIRIQAASAVAMAVVSVAAGAWLSARVGIGGVVLASLVSYVVFVLLPMAVYVPRFMRRFDTPSPGARHG